MQLVRRVTIHGLTLVTTVTLAIGLAAILSFLGGMLLHLTTGTTGAWEALRGELALGLAALVPGIALAVPVRRAAGRLLAEPGERTTATRATYVTGVLLGALFVSFVAIEAGASFVLATGILVDPVLGPDPASYDTFPGDVSAVQTLLAFRTFLAAGVVGYAAWLWHGWRRVREVRLDRPVGTAGRVTRLGLYVGLVYAVAALATALSLLLSAATNLLLERPDASTSPGVFTSGFMGHGTMVAVAAIEAVTALLFALPGAAYARHLVRPGRAHAAQEARSRLRRGAWIALALILVGDLVQVGFGVLGPLVRTALGIAQDLPAAGVGAAGATAAGGLPILLIGYLAWRSHRSEVRRLAPADPEAAGRPWCLALAAWGVGFGAVGAGLAAAMVLSWAVGAPDLPFTARAQFADAAPPLVAGTLAWSAGWFVLRRRARLDPARELGGAGQRAYVGAVGVGAVAATVGASALAAATVLSTVFGADSAGLAVRLVGPGAALAVSAPLAFVSWRTWRRDALVAV